MFWTPGIGDGAVPVLPMTSSTSRMDCYVCSNSKLQALILIVWMADVAVQLYCKSILLPYLYCTFECGSLWKFFLFHVECSLFCSFMNDICSVSYNSVFFIAYVNGSIWCYIFIVLFIYMNDMDITGASFNECLYYNHCLVEIMSH